jgi:membrane-anchored protein YejM (alkaline phosphatase superfamily)
MEAWLLEDADRPRIVIAVLGVLLVVPLLAFCTYLWRASVRLEQRRLLRMLTAALFVGALGLAIVLWRFMLLIR